MLSTAAFAATATSVETEVRKGTDIIVKKSEKSVETGKAGKKLGAKSSADVTGAAAVRGQERADLKLIDTSNSLYAQANTPIADTTRCANDAALGYDILQKGEMIFVARSGITDANTCAVKIGDVDARGNLVTTVGSKGMAGESVAIHAMDDGTIDETEALTINKKGYKTFLGATGQEASSESLANFKAVECTANAGKGCFGLKPVFCSKGAQAFN